MDAGRDRAFEEFVKERSMGLFRTAYLIAGDLHHAEDLLQAGLEKAYRSWERISQMDQPEAYVRRILINLANDRWRGRRYLKEVAYDDLVGGEAADDMAIVDLRQVLITHLRRLPVAMRTVLVLRYWEGLSEAETAEVLGCSVGTVKSQTSRGLSRLRAAVDRLPDCAQQRSERGVSR
jgi:RNA polymerase sigma-70 factor (sigma-E family)